MNLIANKNLFGSARRMRRQKIREKHGGKRQYPNTHTDWKNDLENMINIV